MPPEFLAVGRVLRPHGLRGELLLQSLTDFPERLEGVETVYLGEAAAPNRLLGVRVRRGELLIRLAEVVDREAAEAFRGQLVQIRIEQAAPLPPGQYYHHQIIGLPVVTEEGEALGDVTGILETGANDVYVVSGPQGEILLPAIRSVVRQIDLDARRITVHLLEGLR
ncbi:MAG: ribosome maturation factor RimM [Anaerolineales bacterium]